MNMLEESKLNSTLAKYLSLFAWTFKVSLQKFRFRQYHINSSNQTNQSGHSLARRKLNSIVCNKWDILLLFICCCFGRGNDLLAWIRIKGGNEVKKKMINLTNWNYSQFFRESQLLRNSLHSSQPTLTWSGETSLNQGILHRFIPVFWQVYQTYLAFHNININIRTPFLTLCQHRKNRSATNEKHGRRC